MHAHQRNLGAIVQHTCVIRNRNKTYPSTMSKTVTNYDLANGMERVMKQTLNTMIEVDGVRSAQLGIAQDLLKDIAATYGAASPHTVNAAEQYSYLLHGLGDNMKRQMNTRLAMAHVHDHVLGIDPHALSGGGTHLEFTQPVELAQGLRFAHHTGLQAYKEACQTRDLFARTTMLMLAPVASNDGIVTRFVKSTLPLSRMEGELADGQSSRAAWTHEFSNALFPMEGEVPITAVIFTNTDN